MGYANTCGFSRLGMVIPKKCIKLSVGRNAMKRRIRGYFHASMTDYSLDCVVVATKEMHNYEKREFSALVSALFTKFVASIQGKSLGGRASKLAKSAKLPKSPQ